MFAIIDIETTGNISKYGNITEFAVYQHNGQKITNYYSTLINPGIDIPYYITRLTGIGNEMVKIVHIRWEKFAPILVLKSLTGIGHQAMLWQR